MASEQPIPSPIPTQSDGNSTPEGCSKNPRVPSPTQSPLLGHRLCPEFGTLKILGSNSPHPNSFIKQRFYAQTSKPRIWPIEQILEKSRIEKQRKLIHPKVGSLKKNSKVDKPSARLIEKGWGERAQM